MDRQEFENRYLRDIKFYGQIIGLWPHQKKSTRYAIRAFILIVIMCTNATLIGPIILSFDLSTITEQLLYMMLTYGLLLKQYNWIFNEEKINTLLADIVDDWLMERSQEEMEILESNYKTTATFSSFYKGSILFSCFMFILPAAIPYILDITIPLNETRPARFIYSSYYFVDMNSYTHLIQLHMVVSCLIVATTFCACDLCLVHAVQHACALFAISGYRFQHAADGVDSVNEKYSDTLMDKSYVKVSLSIDVHKKAIEYVELINVSYVYYFCVAVGMVITAFTMTLVKLMETEMGTMFVTLCAFTVAQLTHLLFLTVMGQFVIDSSEDTYQKIYEANWYNCSTKTQALFILALRRCLSTPTLTGGGIISLSLDSFVAILKASFSYFTVLKSS